METKNTDYKELVKSIQEKFTKKENTNLLEEPPNGIKKKYPMDMLLKPYLILRSKNRNRKEEI